MAGVWRAGRLVRVILIWLYRNPGGLGFLERDVRNIAGWFHGRGLDERVTDPESLIADLREVAGLP